MRRNKNHDADEKASADVDVESVDPSSQTQSSQSSTPAYLSSLKIWHGTFTNDSIFKIVLRPFPFLLSPVVCLLKTW